MVLSPKKEIIEEALNLGVSQDDADLLSNFMNSGELLKEMAESEEYQGMKSLIECAMTNLNQDGNAAVYGFEKDIIPNLSKKHQARFFLDTMALIFKDIVASKENLPIKLVSYGTLIKSLADHLNHVEDSLIEIMKARSQLDLNISTSLLLEHVIAYIVKE